MAEWFKAHAWNACVRESVPWVRIPLSPPMPRGSQLTTLSITVWVKVALMSAHPRRSEDDEDDVVSSLVPLWADRSHAAQVASISTAYAISHLRTSDASSSPTGRIRPMPIGLDPDYPPPARRRASFKSSMVCSMMVAGTKLGGNERGGNSLNDATNMPTSSIAP
jgi:hypothetical protein